VEIRAFRYAPDTVVAAPGDTVVWTNADVVPHTATAAGGWDTGEIGAAASGRIVAAKPGTYAYVCAYHPGMQATLVVR
jgi:plastocyanin